MTLTRRTNGSQSANLITANWWNEYHDLLTGAMFDQPVHIKNAICIQLATSSPMVAPLAASTANTSGGLGIGTYRYAFTYINNNGSESKPSPTVTVTTTSNNKQVNLSNLGLGTAGVTGRRIYRTRLNGSQLYLLATINDITTTTYSDTTVDSVLVEYAPIYNSFGSILFKNVPGTLTSYICQDDSNGGVLNLWSKNRIEFQVSTNDNRLTSGWWDGDGLHLDGTFGDVSVVHVASSFGLMRYDGQKLAQFKNNGNLIIEGNRYQSNAGDVGTASGQNYDGFDVAEVFEADEYYEPGVVVCPGPDNKLTRCEHENCLCALVVSASPGFLMGTPDEEKKVIPVALAGRVNIKASTPVKPRDLLVSNGNGGVRSLERGENGVVLGFALNESMNGQVGIFLRSMYVR